MAGRIRVRPYGGVGEGACDYYRLGAYVEHLARQEVDVVPWMPQVQHPSRYGSDWRAAVSDGNFTVLFDDLAEGDVLLFSRWRNTKSACTLCGRRFDSVSRDVHQAETGHQSLAADPIFRPMLAALLANPSIRSKCALVYDLDDDLFHQPEWVGHTPGLASELDTVELLVGLSDLVTVSSPILAQSLAPLSSRVLLVRNAVDLDLYPPTASPREDGERGVSILFYGAGVRREDFKICSPALDRVAETQRPIRRVWLGATGQEVGDLVDEVHPYASAGRAFAEALRAVEPQIGLAPLVDSPFARAKSELHWLEFTAAGAVTIASRLAGAGPYDVIRDGKDGVLVGPSGDWYNPLKRLVRNPSMRQDIVRRAGERVRSEYSTRARSTEWAAAFRWASEHAGIGMRS